MTAYQYIFGIFYSVIIFGTLFLHVPNLIIFIILNNKYNIKYKFQKKLENKEKFYFLNIASIISSIYTFCFLFICAFFNFNIILAIIAGIGIWASKIFTILAFVVNIYSKNHIKMRHLNKKGKILVTILTIVFIIFSSFVPLYSTPSPMCEGKTDYYTLCASYTNNYYKSQEGWPNCMSYKRYEYKVYELFGIGIYKY